MYKWNDTYSTRITDILLTVIENVTERLIGGVLFFFDRKKSSVLMFSIGSGGERFFSGFGEFKFLFAFGLTGMANTGT